MTLQPDTYSNKSLGKGTALGLSAVKRITDIFRLELEVIQRRGYKMDPSRPMQLGSSFYDMKNKADIRTTAFFVNGFYDFPSFFIGNTAITLYLAGDIGISRNKIST